MNNYFRKIVYMNTIDYNKPKGHYKYERRNNRTTIDISLTGIHQSKNDTYKLYCYKKEKEKVIVDTIKTVYSDQNHTIKELIQIKNSGDKNPLGFSVCKVNLQDENKEIVLIGLLENNTKQEINKLIETIKAQTIQDTLERSTQKSENETMVANKEKSTNSKQINPNEVKKASKVTKELEDIKIEKRKPKIENSNQRTKKKVKESKSYSKNLNTLEILKKQLKDSNRLNELDNIIKKKDRMNPFKKEEKNIIWVKIELIDIMFLPIETWMLINNTFLINCYKKYKHLILGKDSLRNELLLGIPDIYYYNESIIANLCGFNEFMCCKDTYPAAGEFGYWIIKENIS